MSRNPLDDIRNLDLVNNYDLTSDYFLQVQGPDGELKRLPLIQLGYWPVEQTTVEITTAQLLALNATPQQLLAAPGAGYAHILLGALFYKPDGTAYAGIAAGEDLAIRYTDGSGAILGECESTGFLDQATAQTRYAYPIPAGATSPLLSVTPVANAALVLHGLTGEIITGNTSLFCRIWTRRIPTTLS